jgi:uncharacterized protein (TIGR00106 family)
MLAEFSIMPLGKGERLSDHVAEVLKLVDASGLDYRLHAMGTEVEGSWDEVMGLICRCHERMAELCGRVYTQIRIDDVPGRTGMIASKIGSVECKIGKKLKT